MRHHRVCVCTLPATRGRPSSTTFLSPPRPVHITIPPAAKTAAAAASMWSSTWDPPTVDGYQNWEVDGAVIRRWKSGPNRIDVFAKDATLIDSRRADSAAEDTNTVAAADKTFVFLRCIFTSIAIGKAKFLRQTVSCLNK
ncbi:uncharacterized protein MYCFIDRAFT_176432 [Pseudocercospora fijiensis CIRAD86]|uniref:Uncharacterized protein n=1 Tax=Pseudocercospora fijiensis (strain CIRAD86) TaxID=383855 RepID=M2ZPW2_PSEFD|nr:uncharacterized protein MYCFIDRAFT_176432 [Pseudocercospora fijiensis CIRAD86]EME81119.1 hypothetical protein MYCFIDRAFT_176432 [Pseudocercospora fijiensis CIRAD86]